MSEAHEKDAKIDELTGETVNSSVVHYLFPYMKPYKKILLISLGLVAIAVGARLAAPRLLGYVVDNALIPKDYELLIQLVILFGVIKLAQHVSQLGQSYFLTIIGQKVMHTLRGDLFAKLIRMPVPFYDRNPTGRLVTRITNDTVNVTELFGPGFVLLISDLLVIFGVAIVMLVIDWKLGLIASSVVPVMILTMKFFSGKLRKAYREARQSLSSVNAFFAERVNGMDTIQLMGMGEHEKGRFSKISQRYFRKQVASILIFAVFRPAITILSAIGISLVLYFGGSYVHDGTLAIGVFVSFLVYVQLLFEPVRSLTEKYNIYQNAMASAERIFSMLHYPEEPGIRPEDRPANLDQSTYKFRGKIEFKDVWFSYHDDSERKNETSVREGERKWALENASFIAPAGKTTAIIGHTGAGKSTLLSLLFRFYTPQMGKILIDDEDISEISKLELRSRLGFVQQDVFIFAGTLRENLVVLNKNASEEMIQHAVKATGLQKMVDRLPKGIDTVLEERGANLSIGERQVIAITRVLIQDPDILILDEATSHIDTETEQDLQHAINTLTKDRTSLVIAHRLSTIADADQVLVFESGKIAQSGQHNDLLQMEGLYQQFWSYQS